MERRIIYIIIKLLLAWGTLTHKLIRIRSETSNVVVSLIQLHHREYIVVVNWFIVIVTISILPVNSVIKYLSAIWAILISHLLHPIAILTLTAITPLVATIIIIVIVIIAHISV